MNRVDALLEELSSRHQNRDPRFLAAVRPCVEGILDAAVPEAARVALLEQLAETFERDVQVRQNCAAAVRHWQSWLENLKQLLGFA